MTFETICTLIDGVLLVCAIPVVIIIGKLDAAQDEESEEMPKTCFIMHVVSDPPPPWWKRVLCKLRNIFFF